jgi:hypothetical protein
MKPEMKSIEKGPGYPLNASSREPAVNRLQRFFPFQFWSCHLPPEAMEQPRYASFEMRRAEPNRPGTME